MGEQRATCQSDQRRPKASATLAVFAIAVALAVFALAWYRLWQGIDLNDESGWLLVPWRWALGDRPFVDEENLAQIPGFLVYPFVKLFAVVRDYDVTGLVLYGRHLYFLMTVLVAAVVVVVLRRHIRWELALLIAALCVVFLSRDTPQVASTTLAEGLLTLGAMLGLRALADPPTRAWAVGSGVAYGLSVIAYPTLLFIVPFLPVFLAFAKGRRALAMIAEGSFASPPDPEGPPTGRPAWLTVSAWSLGLAAVLLPAGLLFASYGTDNLVRCWNYTLVIAGELGQMGGAAKAYEVSAGYLEFVWTRPYLIAAAVVLYIVYRWRPVAGRALLCTLPLALWFAGQRPELGTAGFLLISATLAPYLFLFLPRDRRLTGARVLIWVWTPTLLTGAVAAYTSSLGYVHASMGLFPGVLASALFLAWSLETIQLKHIPVPWPAIIVLAAVLAVVVSYPLRQQDQPPATAQRFTTGPWWGISADQTQHAFVTQVSADLTAQRRPDDSLLVFYGAPGVYLLWDGAIAANSYWIRSPSADQMSRLPEPTIAYLRRRREVPSLIVRVLHTERTSTAQLRAGSGGLDYPPLIVRPRYAIHRLPPSEAAADVLQRLKE